MKIINVIAIIFLILSVSTSSYLFIDIYRQLGERNVVINNYPAEEISKEEQSSDGSDNSSLNNIDTGATGNSYDDVIVSDSLVGDSSNLFANFITWISLTQVNINPQTYFREDAEFLKDINIGGNISTDGDVNIGGDLSVDGESSFGDDVTFENDVTIDGGLEIGGIDLSDNTSLLSGASLIGLYDNNYINISANTTVQGAIGELDAAIASATHNPVTLAGTLDYLTLNNQEITLNQIDITTDVLGATLSVSELNFLDGSTVEDGGLMFGNGTNFTQDTSNLFWDNTLKRLGIGTTAPGFPLDVSGGIRTTDDFYIGTIGLTDFGSPTTSGAFLIGISDEFANSNATNLQAVLNDIDASITTFSLGAGDIESVGSMVTGDVFANASADNQWLGLGSLAGRIEFDDQIADEVNILDANVGIGTTAPSYKLDVVGGIRTSTDLFIGNIGLGYTSSASAGALLVGAYDEFANSTSNNVQDVLDDLDAAITSSAHNPVTLAGLYNYLTLGGVGGQEITLNQIDLATDVSGLLSTTNGGLGSNVSALGAGEILYSTATTTYDSLAAGVSNQLLISGGTAAPGWSNIVSLISSGDDIDVTGTTTASIALEDAIDVTSVSASSVNGLSLLDDGGNLGVFIKDGGNVGIGTTDPASLLSVGANNQFQINSTGNIVRLNGITTSFPSSQGGAGSILTNDGAGTLTWGSPSGTGTLGYWQRNGTNLSLANIGDNIGIGTTAPESKLTVAGGATIGSGYTGIGISAPLNGLLVQGNVGIGTTAPAFTLDVAGSIGPSADDTYDLGSDVKRFRDLYLGPATLHIGTSISDEYTIGYDTGNNTLGFNVNGSGNPEIVFDTSGNVGIGTTAPVYELETESSTSTSIGIKFGDGYSGSLRFNSDGPTYPVAWSVTASYISAATPNALSFYDGSSNVMTLKAGGNVGIGTTVPSYLLHLYKDNPALVIQDTTATATAAEANLYLGESSSGGALQGNLRIRYQNAQGILSMLDDADGINRDAIIITEAANVGIGAAAPVSKLAVGGNGVANAGIYATGSSYGVSAYSAAGIGVYGSTNSGVAVQGSGSSYGVLGTGASGYGVRGESNSTGIGVNGVNSGTGYAIYCDATAANKCGGDQAWFNASDRRLKDNIKPIDAALSKLMNIEGVTFIMKEDPSKTKVMGFIAQDVLPYVPEVVNYDEGNDYYGMQTSQLTALIVEAVKEQQVMIDLNTSSISSISTLGNRITDLENKLAMVTSDPIFNSDLAMQKDLSESYPTFDTTLELGDVVVLDTPVLEATSSADLSKYMVVKSDGDNKDKVLGIVSGKSEEQVNVALAGRVSVKYNIANGEIKAGDLLAVSNEESGKAMKATNEGWVLGRALEDSREDSETIMMTVNLTWYTGDSKVTAFDTSIPVNIEELKAGLEQILEIQDTDEGGKRTVFFSDMNVMGDVTADSFNTLGEITAGFLTIDSDDNSISVLGGGDLKLQNGINSGNIEAFSGELILTADGGIIAKGDIEAESVSAKTMSANNFKVLGSQDETQDPSIGEGAIPAGETEVIISNSNSGPESKIFVTATADKTGNALVVSHKIDGSFTVTTKAADSEEIKFDYWIIGTGEEPK